VKTEKQEGSSTVTYCFHLHFWPEAGKAENAESFSRTSSNAFIVIYVFKLEVVVSSGTS
jgi:hypothetical protein